MRYKYFPLAATVKSYKVLKRNKKIVMVGAILLFVRYFVGYGKYLTFELQIVHNCRNNFTSTLLISL